MLRSHTTCLLNCTSCDGTINKLQCHWSLPSQKNLITNITLSYQAARLKFTLWAPDFMQIKFLTGNKAWLLQSGHNKAVNVVFPHSYSSVLHTDNTSFTCPQCYYVISEKVFALTELLHILKMDASTFRILVSTYCHLPKKSITKTKTLISCIKLLYPRSLSH